MKIKNSKFTDWLISLASIIGIPWFIFEVSEKIEEHFKIPFNYSFTAFWFLIFFLVIFKNREKLKKFFRLLYKFIYNLRYIPRLDEVDPFKKERFLKIKTISKSKKMLKNKKGAVNWGLVFVVILVILLILFYLRQKWMI